MSKLSSGFADYPNLADPARRRLVTDARQWLHELRHRLEPSAPMAPPRLKVQASPQQRTSFPLQLDSPITQIRGVGAKFAARLASIGFAGATDSSARGTPTSPSSSSSCRIRPGA